MTELTERLVQFEGRLRSMENELYELRRLSRVTQPATSQVAVFAQPPRADLEIVSAQEQVAFEPPPPLPPPVARKPVEREPHDFLDASRRSRARLKRRRGR